MSLETAILFQLWWPWIAAGGLGLLAVIGWLLRNALARGLWMVLGIFVGDEDE